MNARRLVSTFSLLAVLTGVLVTVAVSSQAAGKVNPLITPPAGQTAVKVPDNIHLGGTVEAGAAEGPVLDAKVRFRDASGTQERTEDWTTSVSGTSIETNPGSDGMMTMNTARLGGFHGGSVVFEVTVGFPGGPVTGVSPAIPIDLKLPTMEAAALQSPTEIEILFSEPVHDPEGDSPTDWRIRDTTTSGLTVVSAVCCDDGSDRRTLTLATPQDEDASLRVDYDHIPSNPTAGEPYLDVARNRLGITPGPGESDPPCRCRIAKDVIPPPVPTIQQIAGQSPDAAVGNDPTPSVEVGDLREGNVAEVYLESGDPASGWDPDADPLVGTAEAGVLGTATVETCQDAAADPPQTLCTEIGPDGKHTLYAAARDPSGNLSEGADDGLYTLDTVAPESLFALALTPSDPSEPSVDVGFSEAISGASMESDWSVSEGGPVILVDGDGDRRVLTTTGDVPEGATVSWSGDDAFDAAGNALAPFDESALNGLAPVLDVTRPGGKVWTAATEFTIEGTGENEPTTVRVFRDDAPPFGEPDDPSSPVATASMSGTSFSVSVPLNTGPSVDNNFVVQGLRSVRGEPIAGPYADVPTIVQDSQDPQVDVLEPSGGEVMAGGDTFEIRWAATDPNFGPGPIRISYSLDGGSSWNQARNPDGSPSGRQANDGSFEWLVPDKSSEQARVRVTAEDLALRTGSATSGVFIIDADNPFFTAETIDTTHVLVMFSEPVSGPTTLLEWRVDGDPPKSTSPALGGTGITELTLETFQPFEKWDTPEILYARLLPATDLTQLVDRAGNEVSPVNAVAADGIAPDPPTVSDPSKPVTTANATYDIQGTAEQGSLVTAFGRAPSRSSSGGQARGGEAGSQQLAEGQVSYSVAASLVNGANDLAVTATDAAGNESLPTQVPTITANLEAPLVTVLEPVGGQIFGAGSNVRVRWTAVDLNMAPTPITVEYSDDGGDTFKVVGENEANDGVLVFGLPSTPTDAGMVRVKALSQLGRVGSALSGVFQVVPCDIIGTNGNDIVIGTDAPETICSYDGNDFVKGRAGDDLILSGQGRKVIDGGSGDDTIEGGPDADVVTGGAGDDDVRGRFGNDRLFGQSGNDRLTGGFGDDTILGRAGNDTALGEGGRDRLVGQGGRDRLVGQAGRDTLRGGKGNDALRGSKGGDRLFGMKGKDKLSGGPGRDRLSGGGGVDTCRGGKGKTRARSCERGPSS